MGKFLSGFLLGSLLSGGLMFALLKKPDVLSANPESQSITAPTSPQSVASLEEPKAPAASAESASRPTPFDSRQTTIIEPAARNENVLVPGVSLSAHASDNSHRSSQNSSTNAAAANSQSGSYEKIVLSDTHRQVLGIDEELAKMHEDLERQQRDDAWAYNMEQNLGSFFANHAPGTDVQISNIACRSTGCEIAVLCSVGPGNFDNLWRRASKEPWWDFDRAIGRGNDEDKDCALIMFFERAQKKNGNSLQQKTAPKLKDKNITM